MTSFYKDDSTVTPISSACSSTVRSCPLSINRHCPFPLSPDSPFPQPQLFFPLSVPNRYPSPFRTCLSQSHQCLSTKWPPWGAPAACSSTTASPRLSGTVSSFSLRSTSRSPSLTTSASLVMTTPPSRPDTPLSVTSLWRCSSSWVRPSAVLTWRAGCGDPQPSAALIWRAGCGDPLWQASSSLGLLGPSLA